MPDKDIEELIKLHYKYGKYCMESGNKENLDFINFRIAGLGTFVVSEHARKKMEELNEQRNQKDRD